MPSFGKAYAGSEAYKDSELPQIDILIITHDHYDHLDKKTISRLSAKTKVVYTPLGVGKYVKKWSGNTLQVNELDWWETAEIDENVTLTALPARHFSGRGLKRWKTQWASYALKAHGCHLYIGGDSGYDTFFKSIGETHGPFDMAMLNIGQYNNFWPLIHMTPEEAVQASLDLNARALLPVHWGKFTLANHSWNEPIVRTERHAALKNLMITTPMIGEPVVIGEELPNKVWWNL